MATFTSNLSRKSRTYILPDLFSVCALQVRNNPNYKIVGEESRKWIDNLDFFSDKKRTSFMLASFELLASHSYPDASYDEFRVSCDLINVLFVVDDVSDTQTIKEACITADTFVRVLRDSTWDDGSKLARLTREFRGRLVKNAKPRTLRRFIDQCAKYVESVIHEVNLRAAKGVLPLTAYTSLRRDNSAVRPCCTILEYCLGLELPDELFEDETFLKVYWEAVDMVCWSNDIYSYNMEQAKGQGECNYVTVLMKERSLGLQEAINAAGEHFASLYETYIKERRKLAAWGPEVELFANSLGSWVSGNLAWSFEMPIYFGPKHEEVRKTRTVELLPVKGFDRKEIKPDVMVIGAH